MTDFDYPAVRSRAFISAILADLPGQPADLLLHVRTDTILTTIGQIPDVLRERLSSCDDVVGDIQDILELAVPRRQMLGFVEHRDTVTHVLECDAQFFLTLADFVQQPRVLHRDHSLRREILEQSDLLLGEWAYFAASRGDHSEKRIVATQRNAQQSAGGCKFHGALRDRVVSFREIAYLAETTSLNQWSCCRVIGSRVSQPQHIGKGVRQSTNGNSTETFAVVKFQAALRDVAEAVRFFQNCIEHRRQVARGSVDDLQYVRRRGLLLQRLALLSDQPCVFHRDHRLGSETLKHRYLFLGE